VLLTTVGIVPSPQPIQPGAFSVSLAVADLAASQRFYELIGFSAAGGDPDEGWVIMRSGTTTIGLFHGMFDDNILTFNPGWDANGEVVDGFTDVRHIRSVLREAGVEPVVDTDPDGTGPGHIVVVDPDGNQVMFDQFVDRPGASPDDD
jgi:catechol 2,3-dioxygenase-like lactoylglutathione lyase family enzyme